MVGDEPENLQTAVTQKRLFSGEKLAAEFAACAGEERPGREIDADMETVLSSKGIDFRQVKDLFDKLQLPLPDKGEYLSATDGCLVFLNRYGIVIRIEVKNTSASHFHWQRINDNPYVLQPLASLEVKGGIVEICPGCHNMDSESRVRSLSRELEKSGVRLWDDETHNVGTLPIRSVKFPMGVPVVVDRLAVQDLTQNVRQVTNLFLRAAKQGMRLLHLERRPDFQEVLYGPLRKSFSETWPAGKEKPDPGMIREFWGLCQQYLHKGILVTGWNEDRTDKYKLLRARLAASRYARKLEPAEVSSASPEFQR